MGVVNDATLQGLRTGLSMAFESGKSRAQTTYKEIATVVPSTSKSNTYAWVSQFPGMKEWIGERVFMRFKEHSYVIENKTWQDGFAVSRDDFEDDNVGTYKMYADELGYAVEVFPDELVYAMLNSGETELCYDGQYFFDNDHPVNDKFDGTGTDTSVSNIIVDPAYTGDAWYLMDCHRSLKPLIFQERKKPQFTAKNKNTDDNVFHQNEFLFGADCRGNAGFGFWQMCIKVKAELNHDNIWAAIERLKSFTSDGGRKLGLGKRGLKLIAPDTLAKKATQISKRGLINDGGVAVDNELKDKFDVVEPDFL